VAYTDNFNERIYIKESYIKIFFWLYRFLYLNRLYQDSKKNTKGSLNNQPQFTISRVSPNGYILIKRKRGCIIRFKTFLRVLSNIVTRILILYFGNKEVSTPWVTMKVPKICSKMYSAKARLKFWNMFEVYFLGFVVKFLSMKPVNLHNIVGLVK